MGKIKHWILLTVFILLNSIIFVHCTKDREPTAPTEIGRPQIYGIIPRKGELVVSINTKIKLIFNEPMDINTFIGRFILKDFEGDTVKGDFTSEDSIVLFKPNLVLKKSSLYFAELRGRVRDVNRNSIQLNNEPVFDDTTLLSSTWFYTEGDYSAGGFFNIYIRDKKEGRIIFLKDLDSVSYPITSLTSPDGIALSEDGNFLVISNTGKNEVIIASANDGIILKKINVAANPTSCIVKNNYAYVISVNGKSISKIDLNSQSLDNSFTLPFYPSKLAISVNGSILYTFDQVTRELVLINSNNGTIIKKVKNVITNIVSGEIKTDFRTGDLYICDSRGLKVKILDSTANNIKDFTTFSAGEEPIDLNFLNDYVFIIAGNSVYKYDKNTKALLKKIHLNTAIKSFCIVPTGELMYLTLASNVIILDNNTFQPLKEIGLGSTGINTIISNVKKF